MGIKYRNLWICPRCGGNTNTYKHPYAKVWCPNCGYVLRNEGDQTIQHKNGSCKLNSNEVASGIQIVLDGNAWCAYRLPFRNLQEDNAGFGVTPQMALTALLESELPNGWEEK